MKPNLFPALQFIAIPFVVILLVLTSCKGGSEHSYEYVPLSQFTIDSNAISRGSAVQIIAFSGGDDGTKNNTNYFQFIVINKASGDTVRVLSALINVPGDSEKGTYTLPSMFDGSKRVLEANFEPRDSSLNKILKLSMAATDKEGNNIKAMEAIIADSSSTPAAKEWVAVNKSIPIFENANYKTTIGVLKFSSTPW